MAIAYYIPDQRKLLLGQCGGGSGAGGRNNNNNNNCSSHNRNASATPTTQRNSQTRTTTTTTITTAAATPQVIHNNANFRANITIPLTAFSAQRQNAHNVGCWDLITQVFCYAFRFYHENNRSVNETNTDATASAATVIQITVEISGGEGGITGNETTATTGTDTLQPEQPQPPSSPQPRARDKN